MSTVKYLTPIDICPRCSSTADGRPSVVDSRLDIARGYRKRRLSCRTCGYHWNTVEITEEDFNKITRDRFKCADTEFSVDDFEPIQKQDWKVLLHTISNLETELKALKKRGCY